MILVIGDSLTLDLGDIPFQKGQTLQDVATFEGKVVVVLEVPFDGWFIFAACLAGKEVITLDGWGWAARLKALYDWLPLDIAGDDAALVSLVRRALKLAPV